MIFDNQRFEFVSNSLRRVKDRFEQILITRQDIKFVVAERLPNQATTKLATTAEDGFLLYFLPLYSTISEQLPVTSPIKNLLTFKHLERTKEYNLPALKALFELLSLPNGLEVALTQQDETVVQQLQTQVSEMLAKIVQAQQNVSQKIWC